MRPLIDLICKDAKFVWSEKCEEAFAKVKHLLVSAPVLALFDQSKKCYLFTDASGVGVGAVLKQMQSDGELHTVAYFSKTLLPYQRNYTATELELLALVKAVDYWHHYLYDKRFQVITDHQALRYLETFKNKNMRLTKWAIELGSYEFEVIYRVGRENLEADALSRAPIDQVYCDRDYQIGINLLTKPEIVEFQEASGVDGEKRENIAVQKEDDGRVRVIVRGEAMENELFKRYHKQYNHRGVETMLNVIRKSWAVKNLRAKLQEFTKRCETCIKNKEAMRQSIGFLSRMGPAVRPFQIVSIDTKGGFSGYK